MEYQDVDKQKTDVKNQLNIMWITGKKMWENYPACFLPKRYPNSFLIVPTENLHTYHTV